MKKVETTLVIIIGNLILAIGVACFLTPASLISGGATGIALFLKELTGLSLSVWILIINIILFTLGYFFLDRNFIKGTLLSTILYPLFLWIIEQYPQLQHLTNDTLLSALYAGIFVGLGCGLVLREGASTGGTDILTLIIHKKTGLSISLVLNGLDVFILLSQAVTSTTEQILYGIAVVLVTTIVMDRVLLLGEAKVEMIIISPKYEEIRNTIFNKVDRGCTYLNVVTGYQKNEQLAVMAVVSKRQYHILENSVLKIDPAAFIVANTTYSVHGRGFTLPNVDL